MNALELLRYQTRQCHAWLAMTVGDITQEQANWKPPGVANSIGAVYAHLAITADFDVNSRFYGEMPLVAREYRGAVGLSEMHTGGFDWHDWAAHLTVDWPALHAYGKAVWRSIDARLDTLTEEELRQTVDMRPSGEHLGVWPALELYNLHGISHPYLHGGEIACLKGMQGAPGWQHGWNSGVPRPLPPG
jgi:hypothetical protein